MLKLIRAYRKVKKVVLSIIAAPIALTFGIIVFLCGMYDAACKKPINKP